MPSAKIDIDLAPDLFARAELVTVSDHEGVRNGDEGLFSVPLLPLFGANASLSVSNNLFGPRSCLCQFQIRKRWFERNAAELAFDPGTDDERLAPPISDADTEA